MIKSKQVQKLMLARMVFGSMALPVSGSPADNLTIDPTSDASALAAVTGVSYSGGNLPLVPATSTTEGYVVGDIVEVLDPASSSVVSHNGEELYARLSQDGANMKFSFFTNIDGVETAASIDADTVANADLVFSYRYLFANLPEDAITRTKRSYIGDDPAITANNLVTYIEDVTVTANNTLPNPSLDVGGVNIGGVTEYAVEVYVNGVYERGVTYTKVGNILYWDNNVIGYSVVPGDVVVYEYLVDIGYLSTYQPLLASLGTPLGYTSNAYVTYPTSVSSNTLVKNSLQDVNNSDLTASSYETTGARFRFSQPTGGSLDFRFEVLSMTGSAKFEIRTVAPSGLVSVEAPITLGENIIRFDNPSGNVANVDVSFYQVSSDFSITIGVAEVYSV